MRRRSFTAAIGAVGVTLTLPVPGRAQTPTPRTVVLLPPTEVRGGDPVRSIDPVYNWDASDEWEDGWVQVVVQPGERLVALEATFTPDHPHGVPVTVSVVGLPGFRVEHSADLGVTTRTPVTSLPLTLSKMVRFFRVTGTVPGPRGVRGTLTLTATVEPCPEPCPPV